MVPGELSFDACGNAIRRTIQRFDLKNMSILRPDIETAADSAIGAHSLGSANARLAHCLLGFRYAHNRSIAGFGLDRLDYVNHAAQHRLGQPGEKTSVAEH